MHTRICGSLDFFFLANVEPNFNLGLILVYACIVGALIILLLAASSTTILCKLHLTHLTDSLIFVILRPCLVPNVFEKPTL